MSMQITIIVNDEVLDFWATGTTHSFESALEEMGKLQRAYEKRVSMELREKTDF